MTSKQQMTDQFLSQHNFQCDCVPPITAFQDKTGKVRCQTCNGMYQPAIVENKKMDHQRNLFNEACAAVHLYGGKHVSSRTGGAIFTYEDAVFNVTRKGNSVHLTADGGKIVAVHLTMKPSEIEASVKTFFQVLE